MSMRRRMARRRVPARAPVDARRPPGSARAALFVSTLGMLAGAVIAAGAVYRGVALLKAGGGWVRPAMAFVLAGAMLLLATGGWRGVRRRTWPDDRFLFAAAAAMAGMMLLRLAAG